MLLAEGEVYWSAKTQTKVSIDLASSVHLPIGGGKRSPEAVRNWIIKTAVYRGQLQHYWVMV
jgi:hypothetical protein